MSEPKTYTAKDIERYHAGGMSAAEMHLLEKAALDDPALADMLEGYALTATPLPDLEALQNRLQQRIDKGEERKGAVLFRLPWLRVAALFLLIAGAGWLVVQTLSSTDNELAKREAATPAATEQRTSTALPADSAAPALQTAPSGMATANHEKAADVTAPSADLAKETSVRKNRPAVPPQPVTETTKESEGAGAGAMSLVRETAAQPDSTTAVASVGVVSERPSAPVARAATDTIKNMDIVLQRLDTPLEEVVVSKAKRQLAQRRQPSVVIDTLEPAEGWSSFNDYVAGNLHAPPELREKPDTGREVELSFNVDNEGNPVDVRVTKSLCDKCDAEAIRLLKTGPKWKGKKGKVKIKFPLLP